MIDLMFAKFWEATVLTFRIFRFVFRTTLQITSGILNRKQSQPPSSSDDLFEPKQPQKKG